MRFFMLSRGGFFRRIQANDIKMQILMCVRVSVIRIDSSPWQLVFISVSFLHSQSEFSKILLAAG